jgi:hypothetical protein
MYEVFLCILSPQKPLGIVKQTAAPRAAARVIAAAGRAVQGRAAVL